MMRRKVRVAVFIAVVVLDLCCVFGLGLHFGAREHTCTKDKP
jgi:hypothetical protein